LNSAFLLFILYRGIEVPMHKNRFSAQRYANNDRHKRCLIVSKGALVRLTYVASGSVKKSENGVDAKRNADGVMQNNKREKVCAVSYLFRFCKTKFERA
ncbi:hypothetical protein T08_1959, partial [Trichinella sp. T8]